MLRIAAVVLSAGAGGRPAAVVIPVGPPHRSLVVENSPLPFDAIRGRVAKCHCDHDERPRQYRRARDRYVEVAASRTDQERYDRDNQNLRITPRLLVLAR